jgi:hypothetical protein
MNEKKKRKKMIFQLEDGFDTYTCDLLNDDILDNLNLNQEDIKEVQITFCKMPGYLYNEGIPFLGKTTVGGGSFGVGIYTYDKGEYEIQPFLRYDKGHKEGLSLSHVNPQVRLIPPSKKEFYLPDKSTKYNIFGKDFPELMVLAYPIQWMCYNPNDKDSQFINN